MSDLEPRREPLRWWEACHDGTCGHSSAGLRRDRLQGAAERVLDWADHQQPWNPSGDFDALYAATGRRRPEGEEPVGPRYYSVREQG